MIKQELKDLVRSSIEKILNELLDSGRDCSGGSCDLYVTFIVQFKLFLINFSGEISLLHVSPITFFQIQAVNRQIFPDALTYFINLA